MFNKKVREYRAEHYLYDSVYPHSAGAKLIANERLKVFKNDTKRTFE